MADPFATSRARFPATLPADSIAVPNRASFPRTLPPVDPGLAAVREASPFVNVYDPPVQPTPPIPHALPPTGVTDDIEARTFDVPWPSLGGLLTGQEVAVYTTVQQWPAVDVYIQDLNLIRPGEVMTVRVYAISATAPPTLVASGRYGRFSLAGGGAGEALRVPLWVAAARSLASRFLVTLQLENTTAAFSGQFTTVTIVGTSIAENAPPMLGAVRFGTVVSDGSTMVSGKDAELLMVEGVVGEAVAAPRYLHVHCRVGAIATKPPQFCFPLGAGIGAGGGFGGSFLFPPGLRPQGPSPTFQIAASSTAQITTAVTDCAIQGLFR